MPASGVERTSAVVLLVEDEPADQELARNALEDSDRVELRIVSDGDDALDYLHRRGPFAQSPTPDLVLLDLNLPRVLGTEVLRHIRLNPALKALPVVVLSTSGRAEDIALSYRLGCNSYIQKSLDLEAFTEGIRSLKDYWFGLVKLPPKESA